MDFTMVLTGSLQNIPLFICLMYKFYWCDVETYVFLARIIYVYPKRCILLPCALMILATRFGGSSSRQEQNLPCLKNVPWEFGERS